MFNFSTNTCWESLITISKQSWEIIRQMLSECRMLYSTL
uniref:Uncharacterized protein n=1 Tax=Rhizophora mucronata TaxID=61149 RepID=A0A2P2Q8I9_RHIMU